MSLAPLQPFFEWCQNTPIAGAIHESRWLFPAIETVHLFGLTLLLGTTLIVDLRLLGLVMPRQRASVIAGDLTRLTWSGLIVSVLTGLLLFLSEAVKCFQNDAFRAKMVLLVLAVIFQVTVFRKVIARDSIVASIWGKMTAVLSLVLWFGVGTAGRVIGFL